ncbi:MULTISPECIES: acetate/propionate family kinase [unclassified Paracoccus (in: a-proteobacteria)]|uniref:acetate/propionate family kinase n=1 Tax=unclassified Paracoccus (in: a-proteobacteria) TaxID=2688777 RepID=UPI00048BDCF1|nr:MULTISPECIES: acetate/propionate family kinase [unclassified Paracoccus (in: a-proteobacteria)]
MIPAILTLNAGSSSLKFRVFARDGLSLMARGAVSRIGADAELTAALTGEPERRIPLAAGGDHAAALQAVLDFLDAHDEGWRIEAVAHRIVHGGTAYTRSTPVTPQVLQDLQELVPLAPLHQPHGLAAIAAARRLFGEGVPNLACFDTAFHAGRDPLFTHFALPEPMFEQGIRRYGFHGLSYQWIAHVLAENLPWLHRGRVVAAHLGNGASLCAMREGRSIDTTMGMTAVDGIPMGTRSGAVDPGAILLMQRSFGMAPEEIEDLIYNRSGLLGMSGRSNDVAALLKDGKPQSRFALDFFALKCAQAAAAMAVSLGGIDAMIFTGGIGENATPVREAILRHMAPLGKFTSMVIPANEERMMAMEAALLL